MKRALLLALAIAACAGAGSARADGDPASDYLIGEPVFLPFDANIPKEKQRELIQLLRATNASGYRIRVAIIWSTYDLGAITALWKKPRVYARFLGAELQFIYKQRLLIVMPNGFGFNWPHHPSAKEYAILEKIPIAPHPVGLVDAVSTAVQKLAAASGIEVKPAAAPKRGHGHGRAIVILAIAAALAAAVLLRLALRRRPEQP
jgi:hypothetical protein